MPAPVSFLTVLARHPDRRYSFAQLLDLAYRCRYDGPLVLHFRGGIARTFEAGRPLMGVFDTPRLDKARSSPPCSPESPALLD
ncbi:MAG TPA: hypothetical protein VFO16_24215 [Pseudonocardiaceae bacterium]|nr:hypothetical protein [Pseudonocardiaceae bacterium]